MVVKKTNKEFEVVEKKENEILQINSKNDDKLLIYDKKLVQNVIDQKFDKKYKKLLMLVLDVTESEDATDTDSELVLMKIEEFKILIMNNYIKFVNQNTINKYLRKIMVLEERINLNRIKGMGGR